MTEHRVTDLSYGHLGNASYDTEENNWTFSKDSNNGNLIEQLSPFKECIAGPIQNAPEENERPADVTRHQLQSLLKVLPEIYPSKAVIAAFAKTAVAQEFNPSANESTLLAFGTAWDIDRTSGRRRPQIFALPCGSAGHVLQLVRPRRDLRAWGKGRTSAARLAVLDTRILDRGYWVGKGGPILQIVFSDDDSGSERWLAVRQAAQTTIFRPQYCTPRSPVDVTQNSFPPSPLKPNPIATLVCKSERGTHADISFNPWYSRQFAIIDSEGTWEILELEKRLHHKESGEDVCAKHGGNLYEIQTFGTVLDKPAIGHSDGWHRILWVNNINTLVICNRRQLGIFDAKGEPSRLGVLQIVTENSSDWILDVKRSLSDMTQLYVLTTSNLFWLQAISSEENFEDKPESLRLKIIMSYRHFRNPSDATMKLVPVKDGNLSVIITSSRSPLVHVYTFRNSADLAATPWSRQGSLTLSSNSSGRLPINTACILPCMLIPSGLERKHELESSYLDMKVEFLQLWALTTELGLHSTLCAVRSPDEERAMSPNIAITAPNRRIRVPLRAPKQRLDHSFIVQDTADCSEARVCFPELKLRWSQQSISNNGRDDLRLRLNWRRLFEHTYHIHKSGPPAQNEIRDVVDLVENVSERVQLAMSEDKLTLRTIGEISEMGQMKGDLDKASVILSEFISTFESDQPQDSPLGIVLSDFTSFPGSDIPRGETSRHPDLLMIYDQMMEYWMGTLPPEVPHPSRGSKFKIIRQLSLELWFSSLGLSLEKKFASAFWRPEHEDVASVLATDKDNRTTRESSPAITSSLFADPELDFRLPTPSQTPSLYSQATSMSEPKDDLAIIRLRRYVPSITTNADSAKPSFLSHWPSVPGSNPALYSWEEAQKANATIDSEDEHNPRRQKEEARRRKRMEKFLRQERSRAVEAASLSAALPSGSQLDPPQPMFSSQVSVEIPSSQPNQSNSRGRPSLHPSRKNKKRMAGFK